MKKAEFKTESARMLEAQSNVQQQQQHEQIKHILITCVPLTEIR